MSNFKVEHDNCYGNGCPGCLYRGWVIDEDALADYSDYLYDISQEEEE